MMAQVQASVARARVTPESHAYHARKSVAEGDLREFIQLAQDMGELTLVDGADPYLEMGALYELSLEKEFPPVLLFERIKGYPASYRVVANVHFSRVLMPERGLSAVEAYRSRSRQRL